MKNKKNSPCGQTYEVYDLLKASEGRWRQERRSRFPIGALLLSLPSERLV